MNRLVVFEDGSYMPLWQSDLKFMQDGYFEGFKQLLAGVNITNAILTGCNLTNYSYYVQISSGYVVLNGEIVYVPGSQKVTHSGTPPEFLYIEKEAAYDERGNKQFKTNVGGFIIRQTYLQPIGSFKGSADAPSVGVVVSSENRVENILKNLISPIIPPEGQENASLSVGCFMNGGEGFIEGGITYYKRYSNGKYMVYIDRLYAMFEETPVGYITGVTYTMPMGFRPKHNIVFVIYDDENKEFRMGSIKTNGQVTLYSSFTTFNTVPFCYPVD